MTNMRPPEHPAVTQIAGSMKQKGMSTKDIIVALCAAKASIRLRSVMVVDVKAAQISNELDLLSLRFEKQIQKTAQVIQEGIDLISNNRPTAALGSALSGKLSNINQQLQALEEEQKRRNDQCQKLITTFKSNLGSTTPEGAEAIKKQFDELEKDTEKLTRQIAKLQQEVNALKGETNQTLLASNLTVKQPTTPSSAPRVDENQGPE